MLPILIAYLGGSCFSFHRARPPEAIGSSFSTAQQGGIGDMGKASRRRLAAYAMRYSSPIDPRFDEVIVPPFLFRYFSKPEWAEDLLRGNVWLTTLEDCRNREKGQIKDFLEGRRERIEMDVHNVDTTDPEYTDHLRERGFHGDIKNITIVGERTIFEAPDCYTFCATQFQSEVLARRFGPYCVEIRDPRRAFWEIGQIIVASFGGSVGQWLSPITYSARTYRAGEPPPEGRVSFTKDVDPFAEENEYRFAYRPLNLGPHSLSPRMFKVDGIRHLCKRLR